MIAEAVDGVRGDYSHRRGDRRSTDIGIIDVENRHASWKIHSERSCCLTIPIKEKRRGKKRGEGMDT